MFRLLATLLCAAGVLETGSAYIYEEDLLYDHFPEDFLWGAATAAYQVYLLFYILGKYVSYFCICVCSKAILTTTRDQTTYLALVQRPIRSRRS